MGSFLRGWRRKAGYVTLVVALTFMCGWIRSQVHEVDTYIPWGAHSFVYLASDSSKCIFVLAKETQPGPQSGFEVRHPEKLFHILHLAQFEDGGLRSMGWQYRGLGLVLGEYFLKFGSIQGYYLSFPYLMLIIPLTVLSAWLLLSKPRPRAPQTTAPAPTTGE